MPSRLEDNAMATSTADLVRAKLGQAVQLLQHHDLDLWLTFAQETSLTRDPALDLIFPFGLTWQSAFLVHRSGESLAILGRYDAATARELQAFSQVLAYDQSVRPALVEALQRLAPRQIAVNFSPDDPASDGLTHGQWLHLATMFAEAGLPPERVVSASDFLGSLRGQKTQAEVERIRRAVITTQRMLGDLGPHLRPGVTERQVADLLHQSMRAAGLGSAWDWDGDPIVNFGPSAELGHGLPTNRSLELGQLIHLDFGVKQEGFCADLQRTWYLLAEGETLVPEPIALAWQAVRRALLAGAEVLRPGSLGWQVDAAARASLTASGYPEYLHAFGHHLGRVAHDGSTVLGPRWERYGRTPFGTIESNNIFAIELGVQLPGFGPVYVEEDVHVTDAGLEWLSNPQTEIAVLRP
jgi:Xaa-Pro dipeptidase